MIWHVFQSNLQICYNCSLFIWHILKFNNLNYILFRLMPSLLNNLQVLATLMHGKILQYLNSAFTMKIICVIGTKKVLTGAYIL